MKKNDIAMIILIASLSIVIAYFVAKAVLGNASSQTAKVKTVDVVTSEVGTPDPSVFNSNAINPTVESLIGSGVNSSNVGN